MKETDVLTLCIDSTIVKGIISSLLYTQLQITIIEPYWDVTGSAPILPEYLRYSYGYKKSDGTLSKRGRKAAYRVLYDIYNACTFFHDHHNELSTLYGILRNKYHTQYIEKNQPFIKKAIDYQLFEKIITTYHKKISFETVKGLIKTFL